jgi:hypothetical protein
MLAMHPSDPDATNLLSHPEGALKAGQWPKSNECIFCNAAAPKPLIATGNLFFAK